ncbi:MAG TPA: Imm8 family immunity protein [Terriglobales bacterium]|nr:Imm8 family immunity protein [Terriglobales bacterium]
MLKILILTVVALAVFVFFRLVILSFSKSQRSPLKIPPTIDAEAKFVHPLEVKQIVFKNFDLRSGPADPANFDEQATIHVGPKGRDEVRTVALRICTPQAMAPQPQSGFSFQRNVLVVNRYDMEVIRTGVEKYISDMEA